MQVLSSPSSSNPNFTLFSAPNPNPPILTFRSPLKTLLPSPTLLLPPPCSSSKYLASPVTGHDAGQINASPDTGSSEEMLVFRRPVMEVLAEEMGDDDGAGCVRDGATACEKEEDGSGSSISSPIDVGPMEIAKKTPIFDPGRETAGPQEKPPLKVNLELALYRAKDLGSKYQFEEAANILQRCILYWPEDGRAYVALGKMLVKQSRTADARAVYEIGCKATQGKNPYILQCWAVLENEVGDIRRARELFDAATVANKKHVAAWHGWAVLELQQGNLKKARQLLGKGLRFCGGNEYMYQTLALLEAKANRYEQARHLFKQATICNRKSCASWLAWARLEAQLENFRAARQLFEKAIQSIPTNRFAWHVWGLFEANIGNIEKGRKLLLIGHALNPRDAVIIQSLALLEYKYSTADLARVLFRRASKLNPSHQPIWIAWGWMEWKEGNVDKAREYYQKALTIDSTNESAARCLQAWGVLEQRRGNLTSAQKLFGSSLNINSQSYETWMTLASLEEDQGNPMCAEQIRNLYYQKRTEVVDDASWVMGFSDIIDPSIDRIKKLLNMDRNTFKGQDTLRYIAEPNAERLDEEEVGSPANMETDTGFDLDGFIRKKLSLDPSRLEDLMVTCKAHATRTIKSPRTQRSKRRTSLATLP